MRTTVQTPVTAVGETPMVPATEPKTWTFTNCLTGLPVTITCMPGCTVDHSHEIAEPQHPEDISCYTDGPETYLPVIGAACAGGPANVRTLGFRMAVDPFSSTVALRLPHLNLEVMEEHWLEGLDPDALATVIGQLDRQVSRLRVAHAQLTAARAEYVREAM
ncbi:DUF6907 domain-containing protein [Streptomyces sp. NPDC093223]|uniref:DUF6907 domain-containing protein n=1 Tax=Streptomyces sp. NPDC093223 TaxID=3366033 RepID=UPI0037F12F0F